MREVIAGELDIPRTALVMGGNWDLNTPPEDLILSPESQIRVLALGALVMRGLVGEAIFTAGLTRGPDKIPEAEVQHKFFRKNFPDLRPKLHEESFGPTTKADAIYTRDIVEELGLKGPYSLVTTKAFAKRQTKIFEREGFEVVPVVAEPLAASLSPEHAEFVHNYRHSPRYAKVVLSEAVLRAVQFVDPDSHITEFLASRSRTNHFEPTQ
jgi:hypothetical protein